MGGKGSGGFRPKKPLPPGENSRMIKNALEGMKQPRVDTKDVQAVEQRMMDYLTFCLDNDVSPSIAGCANWLGITYQTIEMWRDGMYGTAQHQLAAHKLYTVMQDIWAQKMDSGSLNPVSGIFMSKVFYGYKETQEIVVNHQITNQLSTADLIAESKRLPGADTLSLPDSSQTIDADYCVVDKPIEYNPGKERAEENDRRKAEKRERAIARVEHKNAKQREYARRKRAERKQNKEEQAKYNAQMQEYNRKRRAAEKARKAAERTQKADNADGSGQMSFNFDD